MSPQSHLAPSHTEAAIPEPRLRSVTLLRLLLAVALVVPLVGFAAASIHWPLVLDSPIMHYVVFLMRHGLRPYVDITDNNMPGAYFTEALAMAVFGGSDLAWRMYDFFLLGTLTAGLILIARRYDWLAGLFAGGMFLAIHGPEGPNFAVEREQVITVLLVLAYLAMFAAVRQRKPAWLLLFGMASGVAVSIKPTFLPLVLALLLLMAVVLRRRRLPIHGALLWAATGLLGVFAADLAFLLRCHAVAGFVFIVREVLPAYSSQRRAPLHALLSSFPHPFLLLLVLSIAIAVLNWQRDGRWAWERVALGMGAAFAGLSYVLQGKGFPHHRYAVLVFLLLLMGLEWMQALRSRGAPRVLALAGCLFVIAWFVPQQMLALRRVQVDAEFTQKLEADLQQLADGAAQRGGTAALQGNVQCFDLVYGCLNALYHLNLVENTGFTGDLLLFSDPRSPAVRFYREKFWTRARQDPASVLVVSNEWLERSNSYAKLEQWPEFNSYLRQNYTLAVERHFAMREGGPLPLGDRSTAETDSYRIYVRNGSPLAQAAATLASVP